MLHYPNKLSNYDKNYQQLGTIGLPFVSMNFFFIYAIEVFVLA